MEQFLKATEVSPPNEEIPREEKLRSHKLHRAVTQIVGDLMGDLTGLDGVSNFALSIDLNPSRQEEFFEAREDLFIAKSGYTTMMKIIDPKNLEGRTRGQVEDIIVGSMVNMNGEETRESIRSSKREAYERFWKIAWELRSMGFDDGPASIGAWYGVYEAFKEGFAATYTVLRLSMDEVCDILRRKTFPIYDAEHYKPHFMDMAMEIHKGDQNAPIDEKLVLRLCVYAAFNHIHLNQNLRGIIATLKEDLTLATIFDMAAKILAYGWLMDNWYPEYRRIWKNKHREYDRMISQVREYLSNVFFSEVYTYNRLKIVVAPLKSFTSPFQVLETDRWISGELSGRLNLEPFTNARSFMPAAEGPSITSVYGIPGTHKSTILGDLIALTVIQKKNFVFLPLSDNSNWPTYAFMPSMPISGNSAFRFLSKKMKLKPQGIPVLILNIVRDLSELEERGEVLTKYDRILKVSDHWSFKFDFGVVLDELAHISKEFGYSGPVGMIAVRNMERLGTSLQTNKRFNIEIQNATKSLDSFKQWRRNHSKIPCRVSFDEVKEVQMEQAKSREQSQLGDLIETAANSARRWHFAMDFVGHLPQDISRRVRGFTTNTFWRNLPEEKSEAKSPLSILLDSLPIEPENEELEKQAVKFLSNNQSFAESGLFWWHNKKMKGVRPVYPMVPPFQTQLPGKDPIEIYNFYLKMNPQIDRDKFFRRKADLKYDWVASSEDSTKERDEEETEDKEIESEEEQEAW